MSRKTRTSYPEVAAHGDAAFLLAAIVESSEDAIISKDLDGIITSWNKAAERMLGYPAEEMVGQPITCIIPEDRLEEEAEILRNLRHGDGVRNLQTVRIRKDGRRVQVSLTASPVRDNFGTIIGASKFLRDNFDEQRLAEQARLLDLSNDAIIVRDADDRITYWNRGASEHYGWTAEEARGQVTHKLLRTEFLQPLEHIRAVLRGEQRWQGELVHIRKDGAKVTVSSRWVLDVPSGVVLETNNNITARKRDEEALRQSEQRYRTLFNSMDEGFCTVEVFFDERRKPVDYRFLEVNPAFEKQTGLHEAAGRFIRELVPNHEQHWFDIYGHIALTGEPRRFEDRARGLGCWYDVYAFRIDAPELHRVAIIFTDVSDRKEAQEKLQKLVAERTAHLKETVGELEAFSYTVAHDMRAPLRAMHSFAGILAEDYADRLDEFGKGLLDRIAVSANRLDILIQDVLNYSKVVRADIQLGPVDIQGLLEEIISSYPNLQPEAADINIRGPLPRVIGNRAALTQVFSNLLGNAVKFVGPGVRPRILIHAEPALENTGPTTSAMWHPEVSQNHENRPSNCECFTRIWFEDNGIGIKRKAQKSLFQMFHRLHGHGVYEGTGMGLAIVRKAVERMGGRVGVESETGQGSRFWLELPSAQPSKSSADFQ